MTLHIKKILRQAIIERDNEGLCQVCYKQAVDLHHIVYKSLGGNNSAYNLICLCRVHHDRVHGNGKKWFKILFRIQKKKYPELTKEKMKL